MTDFAEHLDRIRAAGTDPQALALVTLDIVLATHPPELRRAVEAAAIPHWFDERILAALLDEDLRPDAARWFAAVTALPAVERFTARSGYNVHEATRLALRRRLWTETPDRFVELSRRAVGVFNEESPASRIERIFHRLGESPQDVEGELRDLEFELRADREDELSLARTLWEYANDTAWPPLVRGWALLTQALVRDPYVTLQDALAWAEAARDCFVQVSSSGESIANRIVAHFLARRGQAEDVAAALVCLEKSLKLTQQVAASNPESARAERDVALSLSQLGLHYKSADEFERALTCFEKSLEIAERRLQADLQNVRAARDVAMILTHLGGCQITYERPGDLDRALMFYSRALEIHEQILAANPGSVMGAADVHLLTGRVGFCLMQRGQANDVERALAMFEKALKIGERLLEADPQNALIAGNVSTALTHMARVYGKRNQPGDDERALAYYENALEIAERLLKANPQSGEFARDVTVAQYDLYRYYDGKGQREKAEPYGVACLRVLDSFADAGGVMDSWMRDVHRYLKWRFG